VSAFASSIIFLPPPWKPMSASSMEHQGCLKANSD
jgi:hypothetical protein